MSDDLKTLKVDDKWSILYDARKNDRPVEWQRHKKPHTPFSEYNADVAMFYAFQEANDRIEELEKQNASLEARLASLVPALSYEGLRTDEAEAKLAKAVEALQFWSEAVEPDIDKAIALMASTLAKIKGEQP